MTLDEFDRRMIQEEQAFLEISLAQGIWDKIQGKIRPTRAKMFAEALILDLSIEATKKRILLDPAGAAAVLEVVQARI